ncbi:MAG: hypothetical protein IVW57_14190 [Ktedonobacterales bacterium]|nr:hypothetical protein [Ktedonobacterales bacterium]
MQPETITINGREFTITADEFDYGWAPVVTEHGKGFYLGGEDDEDDATPEAAIERGKRYILDQIERGN